jgi:hypothetical protein
MSEVLVLIESTKRAKDTKSGRQMPFAFASFSVFRGHRILKLVYVGEIRVCISGSFFQVHRVHDVVYLLLNLGIGV